MRRTAALALLLPIALTLLGAASPKPTPTPASRAVPRFTGTWRLDTARSEMGRRLPRSREDRVSDDGAWLAVQSAIVRAGGDTARLDYRYRTDGDAVNRMLGQDVKTRGRREGDALRFESEAQLALFKFTVSELWTLSPDGATLTQARTSRSPLGDEKQRLVFRRAAR